MILSELLQSFSKTALLCLAFSLSCMHAFAQDASGLRKKNLRIDAGDTVTVDSLSLVANDFTIRENGVIVPDSLYELLAFEAKIVLFKSGTYALEYRCFPFLFTEEKSNKPRSLIATKTNSLSNPFKYSGYGPQRNVFSNSELSKTGSISRGITLGNNQSLSVNSNLNLQLDGRLSEEIFIRASISDENIPIQPDGNTQQLQDFDQVFIQIYDKNNSLTAGDFQIKSQGSHFLRYLKRAQGLNYKRYVGNDFDVVDSLKRGHHIEASAAVSRGKFSRNVIQGIEGNQGPYRLQGGEGEQFIVILSGTERVYIDGKLLTRGQENDYIINYNTAELSFTAKQFITRDKRIVVEFQYSDRNYARSLIQFGDYFRGEKHDFFFQVYSEQDAKNQSLQQDLNEVQKAVLRNAGDNLDDAFAPGINQVDYSEDLILYALIDSLGYDSVFVFSKNPEAAIYSLRFSDVGEGAGNYILDNGLANGRVYKWIAPDSVTGAPRGRFEPIIRMVSPKLRQMISAGTKLSLSESTVLKLEASMSQRDLNTFSKLDSGDDFGFGSRASLVNARSLRAADSLRKELRMEFSGSYEFWNRNLSEIERIREPEFYRNWDLRGITIIEDQHLLSAGIKIEEKDALLAKLGFGAFLHSNSYEGLRAEAVFKLKKNAWHIDAEGSLLETDGLLSNTVFQKHKSLIERKLGVVSIGYRDDYENNRRLVPGSDSLRIDSYEFWEKEVFVGSASKDKNAFKLFYIQRRDKNNLGNDLRTATFAQSLGLNLDLIKNRNSKLRSKNTYRELEVVNSEITAQEPARSLSSRWEYSVKLFKGAITSSSFIELGSGLEARQEFAYIQVPTGQGVYFWNDYNDNGLQELDEFEIAQFPDQASFIRVFTPSQEYVKVFNNQFNQSLYIQPAAVWNAQAGLKKFLSKFSNQLSFRTERKTEELGIAQGINPLPYEIADTSLISINSSFRNTLYFNRSHPKFGADIGYQDLRNRSLLLNGFEARKNLVYEANMRLNIGAFVQLNMNASQGEKKNNSELFSARNYHLSFQSLNPKFIFQSSKKARFSIPFSYTEKKNQADLGGERAIIRKLGLAYAYNFVGKGTIITELNYLLIDYNGGANNALAFEMLEGLQKGRNITWGISMQQNLANNLQMNLSYNGRAGEEGPVIHAGGIQLRAYF